MPRLATIAVGLSVLAAATALHVVKHDTRRLEISVQSRERTLEKLESDIAVLKAERAYLARPERIEPLARKLGLQPIREQQYARIEEPAEDAIARLLSQSDMQSGAGATTEMIPEELPRGEPR